VKFVDEERSALYAHVTDCLVGLGFKVHNRCTNDAQWSLYCQSAHDSCLLYWVGDRWILGVKGQRFVVDKDPVALVTKSLSKTPPFKDSEFHNRIDDEKAWELQKQYRSAQWESCGWKELSNHQHEVFAQELRRWFEQNTERVYEIPNGDGIRTWYIDRIYTADEEQRSSLEQDLGLKLLSAMRRVVGDGSVVALDWQHYAYDFTPSAGITQVTQNEWAAPIVPKYDSCFFVDQTFRFGILGGYHSNTISVFGSRLLHEIERSLPTLFSEPVTSAVFPKFDPQFEQYGWRPVSDEAFDARARSAISDHFDGYPPRPDNGPFQVHPLEHSSALTTDFLRNFTTHAISLGKTWCLFVNDIPTYEFQPKRETHPKDETHWPAPLYSRLSTNTIVSLDGSNAIFASNKTFDLTLCGDQIASLPGPYTRQGE